MGLQEVKLPDIGEGVTEGELVKWLVKVGDKVEADQAIVELMTDKATVEVPTPYAGQVKELKAKEGDVVPVETVLLILEAGEVSQAPSSTKSSNTPSASASRPSNAPIAAAPSVSAGIYPPVADQKVLATPSTRRLAREVSIDLNQLTGSGLAGRVTREDVLSAKGAVAAGPPTVSRSLPRERRGKAISERVFGRCRLSKRTASSPTSRAMHASERATH